MGSHEHLPKCEANPRHTFSLALGIAALLFLVYQLNGDVLPGHDATANVYLSVSLLEHGNLSYSPLEFPFLFGKWKIPGSKMGGKVSRLKAGSTIKGMPVEALIKQGKLVVSPRYSLTPTKINGVFVNTFGVGAGMCMLPAALWLKARSESWFTDGDAMWRAAKATSALLVAFSAALLFLCCCRFTSTRAALFLALAYGLGTGVWSISSQALWQHGPNVFFLSLGTYFLLKAQTRPAWALGSGAALGYAVLCRPTSAILVVAVGVYLLIAHRKALPFYVLGGLPFLLGLLTYNYYYFDVPFDFGQLRSSVDLAEHKTGLPEIWQTPLLTGTAGLLVSPSRGVLIYSPFLATAFVGLVMIWRDRRWAILRPLSLGAIVIFLLAAKWYDWWGGWCFGYRPVVDLAIFGVLLLLPVIGWFFAKGWRATMLVVLVAWAVGVQVLGAYAYNLVDWNAPVAHKLRFADNRQEIIRETSTVAAKARARKVGAVAAERVRLDIDRPQYRHRLWSVSDSQIAYLLGNFEHARKQKKLREKAWLQRPTF